MRTWKCIAWVAFAFGAAVPLAHADIVTDWNDKACMLVSKAGPGAPGHRMMAGVQVAVYDAVSSIGGKHKPYVSKVDAPAGASVDAAVAAANRAVLAQLMPAEKDAIEGAYRDAIAKVPDGAAKADGIAVGEKAAAAVLARMANDGANAPDTYVPHTTPGRYVPTMIPVANAWTKRKPWVLDRPDQFRPGPPPDLDSETWARDYQEVMQLGARTGSTRTPQQTEIAMFWEETRPLVYHPVVRSVALQPGRSVEQNARLFAAATMAADDALIAVFDAKYTYNFWRPVTAIRNGGGSKSLKVDTGWAPFINTPMHPEYPCAHCVVSGAIASVLEAETGNAPVTLSSSSPTANNAKREWRSVAEFAEEVQMARIYDGVHYRNSAQVGSDLGRKVGRTAVEKIGR
jgi:hypothetical protein